MSAEIYSCIMLQESESVLGCNRTIRIMMREFPAVVSYPDVIFRQMVRVLSSGHVSSEVCCSALFRVVLKAVEDKLYLH